MSDADASDNIIQICMANKGITDASSEDEQVAAGIDCTNEYINTGGNYERRSCHTALTELFYPSSKSLSL